MKNAKYTILLVASLIFIGSDAMAANINARQTNQSARIAQGVASGELTAVETARLVRGQAQLQRMENRARADGVVTRRERAQLNAKANQESAKIRFNKNDWQQRF